jgi:hypothetical protein
MTYHFSSLCDHQGELVCDASNASLRTNAGLTGAGSVEPPFRMTQDLLHRRLSRLKQPIIAEDSFPSGR